MKHAPRIAALLAAAALVLAGCGDKDTSNTATTIDASEPFNDADVSFATDMIPHHAQALVMVDMTRGRTLDPEFEQLTEDIRDAQAPEIEMMAGWLDDWGQPVPATSRDHMHADNGSGMDGMGGMDGDDMPGMMSDDDLDELGSTGDSRFEDMWLRMMIEHHEGAIEMAKVEQADGEYPDAIALAESIESSQTAEIAKMEAMLDS